jgi:hypothetical protein
MNLGSPPRAAWLPLLGAALLGVAGCTTREDAGRVANASPGSEQASSEAEKLALALVEAREAFARRDRVRLAGALRQVEALGGTPAEPDAAELREWRQAADLGPPMRGRPLGPGYRSGKIPAGQSELLEQVFLSGERASIALSAPGNARLTLQVEDRREQPVCARERNPNHCQWVPTFTDRYRIRIGNPGDTTAQYFLVIE